MHKPLRLIVGLLLAGTLVFTLAQRFASFSPWWLELSRYLPYPAYLAPPVLAALLSLPLGRRWLVASLAGVLLVAIVTMDFHWHDKIAGAAPKGRALRLMTYNVKAYKAVDRVGGLQAIAREVALHAPDILVMQDAQADNDGALAFGTKRPILGLPNMFVAYQYVIASRLPLTGCRLRRAGQSDLFYASCSVVSAGRTFTLVTAHFESPRRGLNATRREGLDGAGDWERNYDERLRQSRALADDLRDAPRPLIVAGDLNAPEASPVIRTLRDLGLRDAFAGAGTGYGYTYGQELKPGFSFLRIDHILVSHEIGLADCTVGNPGPSEHRPVIADLLMP